MQPHSADALGSALEGFRHPLCHALTSGQPHMSGNAGGFGLSSLHKWILHCCPLLWVNIRDEKPNTSTVHGMERLQDLFQRMTHKKPWGNEPCSSNEPQEHCCWAQSSVCSSWKLQKGPWRRQLLKGVWDTASSEIRSFAWGDPNWQGMAVDREWGVAGLQQVVLWLFKKSVGIPSTNPVSKSSLI